MNISVSTKPVTQKDLLQTAAAQGNFITFGKAVESAGLAKKFSGSDAFTVFAPTDAAFEKLPPGKLDALLAPANKGELVALLNAHIVSGRKSATELGNLREAKTLEGTIAPVKLEGTVLSFAGANVSSMNIESSNGFLHGIDAVILPAPASQQ